MANVDRSGNRAGVDRSRVLSNVLPRLGRAMGEIMPCECKLLNSDNTCILYNLYEGETMCADKIDNCRVCLKAKIMADLETQNQERWDKNGGTK